MSCFFHDFIENLLENLLENRGLRTVRLGSDLLWLHVASQLDDAWALAAACRKLEALLNDEAVWREAVLESYRRHRRFTLSKSTSKGDLR